MKVRGLRKLDTDGAEATNSDDTDRHLLAFGGKELDDKLDERFVLDSVDLSQRRLEIQADETLFTARVVDGLWRLERVDEEELPAYYDLGLTDVLAFTPGGNY